MVGAAAAAIARPVRVEPVNEIRSTSGCAVSALPTSAPPGTTLKTPSGRPASAKISASRSDVRGVSGDGFNTAVLPNARQGPAFQVACIIGELNGGMSAATPTGSCTT